MSDKDKDALFTKTQFLSSRQRPGQEKDILASVFEDGKHYTIAEAEKAIQSYLKRRVK
ncbi:MAG: hypothetical protein NAG76_22970 [Candidatus Pristimantibacillus lignocellulolyticus]|uniref:YqzN/YkzM domain-containing protein n=1 Tax=Candidatus Pristimantibacillus lignocellulolyticus TaxID=2994561 RepID=A0A9J6ZEP2_9BACL|nr:MAG: hypothetical protein NAG76_22970 [Candidatus Pristimantibacillus lignocellulolyticus]